MRWSFLKTLFDPEARRAARELEAATAAAIETVIAGTDPRLRMVSGYQKKLAPSVARALAHAQAIAQQLPGPVEITRKTFGSDPRVRALFVSVEHLRETFSHNHILRDFLARPQNKALDTCYALLAWDKTEKQVFGTALEGELLHQDVKQTVINFAAQRFITPASDVQMLRRELAEQAFEHLVECALRRLISLKAKSEQLKERRMLLDAKLQGRLAKKRGLAEALLGAPTLDGTVTMEIRHQLADTDEELRATTVSLGTLKDYLTQIQDVLGQPEKHLGLRTITVRLDHSGVKRTADDSQPGENVEFAEIDLGDEQKAAGILVNYSPKEFPPQASPHSIYGV